jgi:proton glutamate symport protein
MAFAPFGIGAAIAVTVGQSGHRVLKNLGILVLTLYGALIVFVLVVRARDRDAVPDFRSAQFWRTVREPWLIAFSTASSEAALPRAMQAVLENVRRSAAHRSRS